jgi:cytochrome P450
MSLSIPGELLLDPQVIENPYPFYRRLHEEAPVWNVPGTDVYVISTTAMIQEATSRIEDFSSNMSHLLYKDEKGLPGRFSFGSTDMNTLATADPPTHTLHKRIVFPEFVAKRMTALEPEVHDITQRILDDALAAGRVDFMDAVGNLVPITVVSRLVGYRESDPRRLIQAAFESTDILSSTMPLNELHAAIMRNNGVSAWIAGQLTEAMNRPSEHDILSSIAAAVNEGQLSFHSAIVILHTLLAAGGESTTSLLGNAARLLAEDQVLQQRLRENPDLIPGFVEEALRFESPFRYHMRLPKQDAELNGVTIPAGSTMLLFWGAANRDPAEFDRPDEFVLDRPSRHSAVRHMAFGRGIHQCVGAPLARLEARIVFKSLLERTKSIRLADDERPEWVNSLEVRRHQRLPVELTPS